MSAGTLTKAQQRYLVHIIVNGSLPFRAHSRVWLDLIAQDFITVNPSTERGAGWWMVTPAGRSALAKAQP